MEWSTSVHASEPSPEGPFLSFLSAVLLPVLPRGELHKVPLEILLTPGL